MSDQNQTISTRVVADLSEFERGMKDAAQQIDALRKSGKSSAAGLEEAGKAAETAADGVSDLGGKAREASQSAQDLGKSGRTAAQGIEETGKKADAAADSVSDLGKKTRDAGKSAQDLGKTGRTVAQELENAGKKAGDTADSVSDLGKKAHDAGETAQELGEAARDAFSGDIVGSVSRFVGAIGGITTVAAAAAAAVAGVAAVGVAAYLQADKLSAELRKSLAATGNAAGLTADQLNAMAQAAADSGSLAAAVSVLKDLVRSGNVATPALQEVAAALVDYQRAGEDSAGVGRLIEQMMDQPAKASAELNQQLNYLTPAVYAQISALEEQGRQDEAVALAQKTAAEAVKTRAEEVRSAAGIMERAWDAATTAAKKYLDQIAKNVKELVDGPTLAQQISQIETRIAEIKSQPSRTYGTGGYTDPTELSRLQESLRLLNAQVQRQKDLAQAKADDNKATKASIQLAELSDQYLTRQQQKEKEIAAARAAYNAATKNGAADQETMLREQQKLDSVLAGVNEKYKERAASASASGQSEVAAIKAKVLEQTRYLNLLRTEGEEANSLTDGQKLVIRLQEELGGKLSAAARAQKEKALASAQELASIDALVQAEKKRLEIQKQVEADRSKELQAISQASAATSEQASALEAQRTVWGKSKSAIEAHTLAMLKEKAATLGLFDNSADIVTALNNQIDAQTRYVAALQDADYKSLSEDIQTWAQSEQDLAETYRDEADLVGMSAIERAKVVAQRKVEVQLAKQIAEIDRSALDDEQKQRLRDQARTAAQIAANTEVTRAVQDEWNKVADDVGSALTQSIFDGGKSGWEQLKKTIEATVIRAYVQPVVTSLVSSVMGSGTASSSSSSSGSSLFGNLGTANSASGLLSSGGASYSSLAYANTVGAVGGDSLGALIDANSSSWGVSSSGLSSSAASVLGYGAALYGLSQGNYGQAIGTAVGTYILPGIGTAIGSVLGSALDGALGGGTMHSGAAVVVDSAGNSSVTNRYDDNARLAEWAHSGAYSSDFNSSVVDPMTTLASSIQTDISSTLQAFGLTNTYSVGAKFSADGDDKSRGGYILLDSNGNEVTNVSGKYNKKASTGLTEFAADAGDFIRQALDAADLPAWVDEVLAGLGDDPTTSNVETALQQIVAFQKAAGQLTPVLGLSADEIYGVVKAFGSLDTASSAFSAYYENFYSDAEKAQNAQNAVLTSLSSIADSAPDYATAIAGVENALQTSSVDDATSAYRALVESVDASTSAGQSLYATLITLAPGFAEASQAAADLTSTVTAAAAEIANEQASLYDTLISALGLTQAQRERELSGLDASNVGLQQTIYGLEDAVSASDTALSALQRSISAQQAVTQAAEEAAQEQVTALQSLSDTLSSSIESLLGSTGASAAGAQAQLNDILETARSTGYLPDASTVSSLVSAITSGLDSTVYASSVDQQRAQLVLAGQLSELQSLTEPQLTAAEQALQAAEDQLDYLSTLADDAQAQLDALRGIDDSVTDVSAAVAALQAALLSESATRSSATDTAGSIAVSLGLPGYASGGYYAGGLAVVGESGPEIINFDAPGQVYTADQSRSLLSGDTSRLEAQIAALTEEVRALRALQRDANREARRTANAVNGSPEQPMLVETV